MFSYLRPHRRVPSTPTSPEQPNTQQCEAEHGHFSASRTLDFNKQRPKTASSPPPSLPPIAIVSSPHLDETVEYRHDEVSAQEYLMSLNLSAKTKDRVPPPYVHELHPRKSSQLLEFTCNVGTTWRAGTQNIRPQAADTSSQETERPGGEATMTLMMAPDTQPNFVSTGRPVGERMLTPLAPTPAAVSNFEPAQHRGKTRLNLLNPMSLLARRRTHNIPYLLPTPNIQNLAESNPLDGYDPRIRGTKIHDFSAPRPQRRNISSNDLHSLEGRVSSNSQNQQAPSSKQLDVDSTTGEERVDLNRWSGGNHTPVFTEDFDEEQYPAAGPNVRRTSDITDLPLPRPPYAKEGRQSFGEPLSAKAGAKSSQATTKATPRSPPSSPGPPVPPKSDIGFVSKQLESPIGLKEASISISETRSNASLSGKRGVHNTPEVSPKDSGLTGVPKHMKSTSSRFSFDMIGAASQEKLLEDRHRQKALEKKSTSLEPNDDMYAEDDYYYDDMNSDDGLEEKIPGVNADAEDDEFDGFSDQNRMAGFTFHSISTPIVAGPMVPYTPDVVSTPRDASGEVIGFAISEPPSITIHQTLQSTVQPDILANIDVKVLENTSSVRSSGLGLQGVDFGEIPNLGVEIPTDSEDEPLPFRAQPPVGENDDDLYFDDGIIDHLDDDDEAAEFDESVFDNDDTDQYGRPIRSRSSLPTLYSPPLVKSDPSPSDQERDSSQQASRMSRDLEDIEEPHSAASLRSQSNLMPKPSVTENLESAGQYSSLQPAPSLTHDTLSAYQSALAAAAYRAAANGRFRRDSSPTVHFDERDEYRCSGEIADDSRLSSEPPLRQPLSPDYEDDFNYDDTLEDDPIIAEANAEALANDLEGFYGQEFGFYSAPAPGETQYGGYFGPRGIEGIVRSQSGRIAGREPNLTPITELSEYSNRNSMMSLPLGGVCHNGPINSPGLAQLAGMMSDYGEEDMSFSALRKLRRGAWGGSQASLRSSNGNGSPMSPTGEDASPITQQSPWVQGSVCANSLGQTQNKGNFSPGSDAPSRGPDSPAETNSTPSSPTITVGNFSKLAPAQTSTAPSKTLSAASNPPAPPAPPTVLISSLQSRPVSTPLPPLTKFTSTVGLMRPIEGGDNGSSIRRAQGHRHSTSADSISYMQEEDPISGARWVLERRRTAESGEVEILGREVVSGGRI